MSTATLIILSARLRSIARAQRSLDPAPSFAPPGRSRVTRSIVVEVLHKAFPRVHAVSRSPRSPLARRPEFQLACAPTRLMPMRSLPARTRLLFLAGLTALAVSSSVASLAHAQEEEPSVSSSAVAGDSAPATKVGVRSPAPCVQVDIAGHRAGHLDCATQRLEEAARIARRDADAARDLSVAQAGSPDVQVGVASRAGTRLRLRENFGVSIRPPAVSPPVVTNPMGRRP